MAQWHCLDNTDLFPLPPKWAVLWDRAARKWKGKKEKKGGKLINSELERGKRSGRWFGSHIVIPTCPLSMWTKVTAIKLDCWGEHKSGASDLHSRGAVTRATYCIWREKHSRHSLEMDIRVFVPCHNYIHQTSPDRMQHTGIQVPVRLDLKVSVDQRQ